MAKYATVDEYMTDLPVDRRAVMQALRRTMAEAAPQATEAIAYNMPALRLNGRFLISYEAFKNHYSVFPWTERMAKELGDELKPYKHGKGTLRFPAGESIPTDLIARIVRIRLDEVSRKALAIETDDEGDTVGAQLIDSDADLERLLHDQRPSHADEPSAAQSPRSRGGRAKGNSPLG
jgi:uncharacterized protein YdhG (YjbR/CyaY superfamily)